MTANAATQTRLAARAERLHIHHPSRALIYRLLVTGRCRAWNIRAIAEELPDVSVEMIRTTIYLLLGDGLVELVRAQRVLTVRLADGAVPVLMAIVHGWIEDAVARRQGDIKVRSDDATTPDVPTARAVADRSGRVGTGSRSRRS